MTERGQSALERSATRLGIGRSSLRWTDDGLTVDIDEIAAPLPARLRGTVRLIPTAVETFTLPLTADGGHRWRPIAPCARAEIALESPALRWSGSAYCDSNAGDRPLEADFIGWDWSRVHEQTSVTVYYDLAPRDGDRSCHALRFHRAGGMSEFTPPPRLQLPTSFWRMPRSTRAPADTPPHLVRTLEDSPFYTRSLLAHRDAGGEVLTVHESLSLDRFRTPWLRLMLPVRMPRALR